MKIEFEIHRGKYETHRFNNRDKEIQRKILTFQDIDFSKLLLKEMRREYNRSTICIQYIYTYI